MGISFSASIDSTNKVKLTQNAGVGVTPTVSQNDLAFTTQLETFINNNGYLLLSIDPQKIKTYVQTKVTDNLNILNISANNLQFTPNLIDPNNSMMSIVPLSMGLTMFNQYLLTPVILPQTTGGTPGQFKILIPNFYFDTKLVGTFKNLLKSFNPTITDLQLAKMDKTIESIQNAPNPKIAFINLISISLLISVAGAYKNSFQPTPTSKNGDTLLIMYFTQDIINDCLKIINQENSCDITSQILTYDNALCTISTDKYSGKDNIKTIDNTLLIYGLSGLSILLFIILIVTIFMGKSE